MKMVHSRRTRQDPRSPQTRPSDRGRSGAAAQLEGANPAPADRVGGGPGGREPGRTLTGRRWWLQRRTWGAARQQPAAGGLGGEPGAARTWRARTWTRANCRAATWAPCGTGGRGLAAPDPAGARTGGRAPGARVPGGGAGRGPRRARTWRARTWRARTWRARTWRARTWRARTWRTRGTSLIPRWRGASCRGTGAG